MIRFKLDSTNELPERYAIYSRRRFVGWVYGRPFVQEVYYGDGKTEAGVHFFKQIRWYLEYPFPGLHKNVWRRQVFESKWRAAQVLASRVRELDKRDDAICMVGEYSTDKDKQALKAKTFFERAKEWVTNAIVPRIS